MSEQTVPSSVPVPPPAADERVVILWRNGETAPGEALTYQMGGRVLLFAPDSEEATTAKKVDLFEEAGDILKDRNGRKVAVPRSVAEIINPAWTFVDAT